MLIKDVYFDRKYMHIKNCPYKNKNSLSALAPTFIGFLGKCYIRISYKIALSIIIPRKIF